MLHSRTRGLDTKTEMAVTLYSRKWIAKFPENQKPKREVKMHQHERNLDEAQSLNPLTTLSNHDIFI